MTLGVEHMMCDDQQHNTACLPDLLLHLPIRSRAQKLLLPCNFNNNRIITLLLVL
jgi:hypothetical protein